MAAALMLTSAGGDARATGGLETGATKGNQAARGCVMQAGPERGKENPS
jgi:hypothetical protein